MKYIALLRWLIQREGGQMFFWPKLDTLGFVFPVVVAIVYSLFGFIPVIRTPNVDFKAHHKAVVIDFLVTWVDTFIGASNA